MKSEKKLPVVVTLLILTLITVIFWISFGIYRSFTNEPESTVSEETLLPLNPILDTETINEIKERKYVENITESFIQIDETESTTEIPDTSPSPIATQGASLE